MASKFVGVRVPEHLAAAAETVAEGEMRSLSNYIVTLIAQDLERRASEGEGPAVIQDKVNYTKKRAKTVSAKKSA